MPLIRELVELRYEGPLVSPFTTFDFNQVYDQMNVQDKNFIRQQRDCLQTKVKLLGDTGSRELLLALAAFMAANRLWK